MYYPRWEVPWLGGGMVIALVATIHVMIAHFAIGAGFFIAISETLLRRRPNPLLLDFLKRFGKFIIVFSFVAGSLTGVGIWFAISLASPRATSTLLHLFVWGWAAEYAFFLVEIASGYAYYYGFERLGRRREVVAWIYAIAAFGSLFIINGIIAFMLSPGRWLETGNFWHALFNPTYWPTLFLRLISSLALAGIFASIVANAAYRREQAHQVIRHASWFLAPLALMIPLSFWFFAAVPQAARHLVSGGAVTMNLFFLFGIAASTLVGLYAFVGLIWRRRYINMETAVLLAAVAFLATASMEMVREGIRKPWLIYDVQYSSGWQKDEEKMLNEQGVLASNAWLLPPSKTALELSPVERGRAVYDFQCAQCHNIGGINDIVKTYQTWDEDLLRYNLPRLHLLRPFMPPPVGTAAEREALVQYLLRLRDDRLREAARP